METREISEMTQLEKTCCFSGHRKIPPQQVQSVVERLEKVLIQLIEDGFSSFCAGGALGFDSLASLTVLKLKKRFPSIKLILVLPCRSQTRGWRREDIETYEEIKAAADEVKYTSEAYTRGCMHLRNRYLADHSSVCVCYLTQSSGGTAYTVNYAKKKRLSIINLAVQSSC